MAENLNRKNPISQEWYDVLTKDNAFLTITANGQLEELAQHFPKDMEFPQSILTMTDEEGFNFLQSAANKGFLPQVTFFAKEHNLDLTAPANQLNSAKNNFVFDAALQGYLDQVTDMAEALNLDVFSNVPKQNEHDYTFLHYAAQGACLDQVPDLAKRLNLDLNEYIDKQNMFGKTVIHQAIRAGTTDQLTSMVKELNLDITPVLNKQDTKEEKTFLHYAAETGNFKPVSKMAEELGLDLSSTFKVRDKLWETFFHTAAENKHLDTMVEFCKEVNVKLTPDMIDDKVMEMAKENGQGAYANKLKEMANSSSANKKTKDTSKETKPVTTAIASKLNRSR
ncbi:MAG: ankyrin repeat domain-containing protein [Alphaproteobacteria bacterium]